MTKEFTVSWVARSGQKNTVNVEIWVTPVISPKGTLYENLNTLQAECSGMFTVTAITLDAMCRHLCIDKFTVVNTIGLNAEAASILRNLELRYKD